MVDAAVSVKGYYRSNGTYVQPHYRSNPDGNPYNNWSYPGNTNPYTGETAGGNPDTYLKNYYGGSSPGYSGGSSNSYSPSYGSSLQYVTGGYLIGGVLSCNSNYYKKNGTCISAPANSTAYGLDNFYCNSGSFQSGDSCVKPTNGSYYGGGIFSCTRSPIIPGGDQSVAKIRLLTTSFCFTT